MVGFFCLGMTMPTVIKCIDQFGRVPRYLRISVTGRCNLRCLYCAPESDASDAPDAAGLDDDEIVRLAGLFARLGVNKVRFTGGEPLLRAGLADIMARVGRVDGIEEIALSTNAYLLESYLPDLVAAGMRTVNISCDTLRKDRFFQITRRRGLGRVLRAIDAACTDPQIAHVKLNVVVMRGINDDELPDFLAYCDHPKIHVRFIEFMPTADVAYSRNLMVSEAEMR
jgi:cyclic pyranopterin phosphate synthase